MVSLANYENLTIRISRVRVFRRNDGNGNCRFVAYSDEIAVWTAHGATIADALNNFQKAAEVWLRWFGKSP